MSIFDNRYSLNVEQIQKIANHFGIGKVINMDMSQSIEISTNFLNLYLITTNKDQFVVIECPNFIENISEIQKAVDLKFNFQKTIFVYPDTKKNTICSCC